MPSSSAPHPLAGKPRVGHRPPLPLRRIVPYHVRGFLVPVPTLLASLLPNHSTTPENSRQELREWPVTIDCRGDRLRGLWQEQEERDEHKVRGRTPRDRH